MTHNKQNQFFTEMSWNEVRPHFLLVEPKLVEIIDGLSPSNKYKFLKISYPYGTHIFANKIVHIPSDFEHNSVPLSDPSVASWIKKSIGYAPLPLGVIADQKGAEFFIESDKTVHPIAFCVGGCNLGIWEFFEPPSPITITAGARSSILVPKIMDAKGYVELNKYGIKSLPPATPFDQWHLFKKIVANPNFFDPWVCDVFYFSEDWIKQIKKNPAWIDLKYFILQRAWQHTSHSRNRFLYNDMWESFVDILSQNKIKPSSYLLDVFKHLVHVAIGSHSLMLYKPTDGNETAGPVNTILKVFLEVYGLKTYAPTLMMPTHFDYTKHQSPVYCPLQIPTWWNSAPKSRDSVSTKYDLVDLMWIYERFLIELKQGNIRTDNEQIIHAFEKISFDFFHSDVIKKDRIQSATLMSSTDQNLLYLPGNKKQYGPRKFADRSTFARGCVRISVRKK